MSSVSSSDVTACISDSADIPFFLRMYETNVFSCCIAAIINCPTVIVFFPALETAWAAVSIISSKATDVGTSRGESPYSAESGGKFFSR